MMNIYPLVHTGRQEHRPRCLCNSMGTVAVRFLIGIDVIERDRLLGDKTRLICATYKDVMVNLEKDTSQFCPKITFASTCVYSLVMAISMAVDIGCLDETDVFIQRHRMDDLVREVGAKDPQAGLRAAINGFVAIGNVMFRSA